MFKIATKQIKEIVSKYFNENDPLIGFCVATRLRLIYMNSGTKYIGYSKNKMILCQMFGVKKEVSNDIIELKDIIKIKKTNIPFSKIYTILYKKDTKRKAKYKLWFLSVRGYKENISESMRLVDLIQQKLNCS